MSTFTEDRAAKVAGNLAEPAAKPVEQLKAELSFVGIQPETVATERLRRALDLRGKAIDTMSPATQSFVEQRSKLSFIVDSLGPNGENILTENGVFFIVAAEVAQDELAAFNSSYERINSLAESHANVASAINHGLEGFEGIVGIVDSRKLEGGGEPLKFDMSNFRDVRLSQAFKSYVDQWVQSGMGDPKLIGLSADQLLVACSNFPTADRLAFDLSHPDQVGKVTGESLSFSIGGEFQAITLGSVTREDGTKAVYKGIDPGPTAQVQTGPLDR